MSHTLLVPRYAARGGAPRALRSAHPSLARIVRSACSRTRSTPRTRSGDSAHSFGRPDFAFDGGTASVELAPAQRLARDKWVQPVRLIHRRRAGTRRSGSATWTPAASDRTRRSATRLVLPADRRLCPQPPIQSRPACPRSCVAWCSRTYLAENRPRHRVPRLDQGSHAGRYPKADRHRRSSGPGNHPGAPA